MSDPACGWWNGGGRLTRGRAAGAGAMSGVWAGLLFGVLLGLFTSGHSIFLIAATGAALGALWGGVFGFAVHASTKGQRDFARSASWWRRSMT